MTVMDACSDLSAVDKCLAVIAHGVDGLSDGNFSLAEGAFRLALAAAKMSPPEQGRDLVCLVLLNLSRLRERQNVQDEARRFREQANIQLEQSAHSISNAFFDLLMAAVLMDLGEYRRAISFWEQAIQLGDCKDPIELAHMLSKLGECYTRT